MYFRCSTPIRHLNKNRKGYRVNKMQSLILFRVNMYWSSTEHWLNEQSIHWVSEFMATDVRMPGIGLIVSLFLINDSGTQQTNFESRIRCTWYRFAVGTEQRIVLFCSAQAGTVYCLNAKLVSHSSRYQLSSRCFYSKCRTMVAKRCCASVYSWRTIVECLPYANWPTFSIITEIDLHLTLILNRIHCLSEFLEK